MADASVEDLVTEYIVVFLLLLLICYCTFSILFCMITYGYSLTEYSGSFDDVLINTVICYRGIPNFHDKLIEEQIDEKEILIERIPV